MHKSVFALLAALTIFGPTGAVPQIQPANIQAKQGVPPARRPVTERRIAYVQPELSNRDRLGACGNYAAELAMGARNTGAAPDAQERVMKLAFVLCMAAGRRSAS